MALTQASLKAKLKTELQTVFTIIDANTLDKACGAIAQAIVDEITQNAIVPAGSFTASTYPVTGSSTVT